MKAESSDQDQPHVDHPDAHHRRRADDPKYVPLWNNLITMAGLFLVGIAVTLMLTFWLFALVTPTPNPYIDIVGYLVLPGILIVGVILLPIGIFIYSWRLRRRDPQQRLAFRFPKIDLNDPLQRRAAKGIILGMFILLPVVAVSGYHGYHYTDSAEFCSKACHTPMHPQATTYEHSAHARVACAECHIGKGASWFVKSKLSGTRQVLAMWQNTFSRPIPPAIHNLRPARETCEQCHWPRKFFGAQLREIVRFKSDEANTRVEIDMLLRTGGTDETTGYAEGIHMHMALEGRVEYVAVDNRLQEIPWVRYVDRSGAEWIYRSDGRPSSDPRPAGQLRQFDCMDCHNRPAHKFRSPQDAMDLFLGFSKIDPTLPYIKREGVAALVRSYPDAETAEQQIANHLIEFYSQNYPDILKRDHGVAVNNAIDKIREIYRLSFFPEMKVDWRTYPDNIGHHISPGCFRCHEGKHINQVGKLISHDCAICHTFLNPVQKNGYNSFIQEGEFIHPMQLDDVHAALRCSDCHTGGLAPRPTCTGCHAEITAFRQGTLAAFERFKIKPDVMADLDCEACHDLSEPTSLAAVDALCMECHEDEEERFEGMLGLWKKEADELFKRAANTMSGEDRAAFDTLRRVGPQHNIEATRAIFRSLLEPSISSGAQRATPDS